MIKEILVKDNIDNFNIKMLPTLRFHLPATCILKASFSVPASQMYSPASFFSTLLITSCRVLPFDSVCSVLVDERSLPSLYHLTSVFKSETSQLKVAFWETVTFTSFWTESLLEKTALISAKISIEPVVQSPIFFFSDLTEIIAHRSNRNP